jgi:hypothetical protein
MVRMNVTGAPHADITLVPGGNPGTTNIVGLAQTINMVALAMDPQGIKNVVIEGHVEAWCTSGNASAQVTYLQVAMNPDPGGSTVLTERITLIFHDASQFTACQPGFTYGGHWALYKASATNFSDTKVTTADYTINHTP